MAQHVVEIGGEIRFQTSDVVIAVDFETLAILEEPNANPFSTDILCSYSNKFKTPFFLMYRITLPAKVLIMSFSL